MTDVSEDQQLPPLEDGELASVSDVACVAKQTKPPVPYTEGTLLDDMMNASKFIQDDPSLKKVLKDLSGLGTAATRDSIMESLKGHGYLTKTGKNLLPTEKGIRFINWVDTYMPELTDVAQTARWEARLAVVAREGNGKQFERDVAEKVKTLVSIFKKAEPMPSSRSSSTSTTENSSMSENKPPKANKPSDKMLEFAKSIAKKVGVRVPDEVMADWDACKAFIDQNKDAAMRPSEKQLSFANSIAQNKGLTIPEEVLANGKELSRWIDDNR